MSFFNGGNPDIGFYYSNRLYNGIGGGSSFYDNIQTKLPLRDPLTGRFIRTSPPSGFFREQAIQAPELPGLTGGTARQLNLFNPNYIQSDARFYVTPSGQVSTSLPYNLPVPVRGNQFFYGQQSLPGINPPANFQSSEPFSNPLPRLTGGTARQLNLFNQRPANIGNALGSSYGGYRHIPSYGLQGDLFKSGYGFSGVQTNYSSGFSSPEVSPAPVPKLNKFNLLNERFFSPPYLSPALSLLGVASAYGSGNQERADSTVIPALAFSGSAKLLDLSLTQSAKEAIKYGQTSIPFVGKNLSLAENSFVYKGSRIYPGSILESGAPIRPFQFSKSLGFGNTLAFLLLANDTKTALSANPLQAREGLTSAGAGVAGIGAFYAASGALASTGIGALPAAALSTGAAILASSAAGAALGLRPYTQAEQSAIALDRYRKEFISSGLDLGGAKSAAEFGTTDFTKNLNFIQSAATGISTYFDLRLGALNPLVTGPAKFLGAPTPSDVRALYGELANRAKTGVGEFSNSSPGQIATELLKFGAQSGPVGNIGDIVSRNGNGQFVDQVIRDTDSLIADSAGSLSGAQRYAYITAQGIDRDVSIAKTSYKLAAISKEERRNISRAYRAPVVPVGDKRTIETYDFRTGQKSAHYNTQSVGDLLFSGINKAFTEIGRSFSRGKRNELDKQTRIYTGAAKGAEARIESAITTATSGKINAYEKLLSLKTTRERQDYAKSLSSRQLYSDSSGSSGGSGRVNYGAQYAARQAAIQADRTFSAGNRLLTQKFEEALSTLTAPSYGNVKFDYRSVDAAVADLTPGSVLPEEFKQRYSQAYQQQLGVYQGNVASAQRDFAAFRENAQSGANRFIQQLRSRSAPTAAGRLDVETSASRIQTDLNRVLIRPSQEIERLTKNIAELSKQMNPATENSFAYFVAKTAKAAQGDTRYFQSQGVQTAVAGYRAANYQLETDRRLGLVSNERFIRETASNDRAALGQQYSLYNLTLSDYENRINAQAQTLRANGFNQKTGQYDIPPSPDRLSRADQLEKSFEYYKKSNQRYFDDQYARLSPEETNRRIQQARQASFGQDFQPYFNAVFKSAVRGVNPISALGTQFSNSFSSIGGSATANLLSKSKFVGDIFGPLINGDVQQLSKNLSTRFGGSGGGIALAGFATPDIAQKSISYGTIGYAASQQLANYISPYQNQAVGSIGSLAGGLIGSAFGPIGTGVGSALGGLLGAAPFTQGPIGGGLTGAAAGALAGSFLGPIGAIGGGILGGLFGFLGGKQSKQQRDADRKAKQLAAFQAQVQGRNYAKSYLSGGVPYAADLFDGYGDYSQKLSRFQDYISPGKFASVAGSEIFDSQTLDYAKSAFGSYTNLFQPVEALAERYRSVISRPGSFQGAIFDVGLRNAQIPISAGPFSSGPASDLLSSFSNLQSSLGQYGFDPTRGNLAYGVFSGQYQNQLQSLDYQISQGGRDYQSLLQANLLSATSRGIQTDVTNRRLSTFDRDSRNQIEAALGTLQRRENRSATVAQLKDDQAFEKDILTRQAALQSGTFAYQAQQDQYQSQDALKSLQDLTSSRTILVDAFNQLAPKLTDASSEFYQMSEAIKEVNQQLELLSRNLR